MLNVAVPGQTQTRFMRRPNFPIHGKMKPFGLYPIMVHPVLPGETLEYWGMKWGVVSKPVKNPLTGCWLETWLMYVKFTDIDRELGNMFVSDSFSSAGYTAPSAAPRMFTKAGQVNWVEMCTKRVHEAFFVHENETPRTMDGVPKVKANVGSWYQNMIFKPDDEALGTTDVWDADQQLTAYQMLQQMQMTELTYEKYLQQYGVQSIVTGIGQPEILRYGRSWTQPVNHVDPSDGSPSAAWVWRDELKAEKPKRFDEPGFIIALAAVRPKMFSDSLSASMVGNLWGFSDWYPAYNLKDPIAGVKEMSSDDPVFNSVSDGAYPLLYDHRDLLSHGEQFINLLPSDPAVFPIPMGTNITANSGDEPEDLRGEYFPEADIEALFVGTDPIDSFLAYDGICSARIKGHITDTTR